MNSYETKQLEHDYITVSGDERIYSPIDYNLSQFVYEKDCNYIEKYQKYKNYSKNNEFYIPNIEKMVKINLVPQNIDRNIYNYPQELLNGHSYNEMYEEFMEEEKELLDQDNDEINYNDDILIKNLDY